MRVQNHRIQFIFVNCFYTLGISFLVSLGYFLGFDITASSLLYYFLTLFILVLFSVVAYILFMFCYKSYTEISGNKITVLKKNKVLKEIDAKTIMYCKYSSIWNQLLLGSTGGYYRVYYEENDKEECLFISLSKKQAYKCNIILKKYI